MGIGQLNRRSFYFVEISTGETRHIQQLYVHIYRRAVDATLPPNLYI